MKYTNYKVGQPTDRLNFWSVCCVLQFNVCNNAGSLRHPSEHGRLPCFYII